VHVVMVIIYAFVVGVIVVTVCIGIPYLICRGIKAYRDRQSKIARVYERLEEVADKLDILSLMQASENRWIPCEKKLPMSHVHVLASLKSGYRYQVMPMIYVPDMLGDGKPTWFTLTRAMIPNSDVVAWQPMPEPCKYW